MNNVKQNGRISDFRYGDKSPKSGGGRLVGLLWLFMSAALMSGFTAMLTSSLSNSNRSLTSSKVSTG